MAAALPLVTPRLAFELSGNWIALGGVEKQMCPALPYCAWVFACLVVSLALQVGNWQPCKCVVRINVSAMSQLMGCGQPDTPRVGWESRDVG